MCHSAKSNHPKSLQDMHYTSHYRSPLGNITLASDGEALTGLWFDGQRYFAAGLDPKHSEYKLPVFEDTRRWLDNYFSGKTPDFTPPLHLIGSPFRQHVWTELLRIGQPHRHRLNGWSHVSPGRGRGCGTQSCEPNSALPSRGGHRRKSYGLCRRNGQKTFPARTGRHRLPPPDRLPLGMTVASS